MGPHVLDVLAERQRRRDAWLERAIGTMAADDRILAAWVVGSLGRGDADALSDVDLCVVVDGERGAAILAGVDEVARFGALAWADELPANAPPGGAYVSSGYPCVPFPLTVDWYWQPVGTARVPSDAAIVLDKVGVARSEPPTTFAELMARRPARPRAATEDPGDLVAGRSDFFWRMAAIAAKYGARQWDERAAETLALLGALVDAVGRFTRVARLPRPPPDGPLATLRALMEEMEEVSRALVARGDLLSRRVRWAYEALLLAERLREVGWPLHPSS